MRRRERGEDAGAVVRKRATEDALSKVRSVDSKDIRPKGETADVPYIGTYDANVITTLLGLNKLKNPPQSTFKAAVTFDYTKG